MFFFLMKKNFFFHFLYLLNNNTKVASRRINKQKTMIGEMYKAEVGGVERRERGGLDNLGY